MLKVPTFFSPRAVPSLDKLSGVSLLGDLAVGLMAASGVTLAGGERSSTPVAWVEELTGAA